jgi:peptide/nickel transport system ATP-binding protein
MTALEVRGLEISAGRRPIVTGIDFSVAPGEALAIVGESGSGKSLTARSINRVLPAGVEASGSVSFGGRELLSLKEREMRAVRGREIGMIFQDPFTSLDPLVRCGAQITEALRDEHGNRYDRRTRERMACELLAEVGIEDPAVAKSFPFELSGGMRQRVVIASALALDPKLLIADEPSTALDVITQREILARIKDLQASRGMSLILITHDLRVAFSMCDRVNVLYAGRMLESAPAEQMEREPYHPYTLGLLLSEPPADHRIATLTSIPGSVPEPSAVAGSCAFAPRCRWAEPRCREGEPDLVALAEDSAQRLVACIRSAEIGAELASRATELAVAAEVDASATAAEPLVAVRGLTKVFGEPGGRLVTALDDVGLEVGAGECVGLVGQSGSGKTTLGRCLLGLETANSGTIEIGGLPAAERGKLSRSERQKLRREVQMVFQDPYSTLNPVRTVGATLDEALAAAGTKSKDRRGATTELLEQVGLPPDYASRKPGALSGGERQRVAIARALATKPKLMVCDEAVSALDVSVQAQVLNLIRTVHRETGVSILFITHDLAVVRQVTDRVYVLHKGTVVEAGPTDRVLDSPSDPYTATLLASVPRPDHSWLDAPGPAVTGSV